MNKSNHDENTDPIFVPNITNYISGEKIVVWRNFSFPCITIVGKLRFLHMWINFRCLHMTDVEKSDILHIWHVCDVKNVAIYAKFMQFHVEKNLAQKYICGKNDKYQVCLETILLVLCTCDDDDEDRDRGSF